MVPPTACEGTNTPLRAGDVCATKVGELLDEGVGHASVIDGAQRSDDGPSDRCSGC